MVHTRRIVFVCSGNICRSPMAEAIARSRFAEASIPARFLSMGTLGLYGQPASEFATAICSDHGLDLTQHVSQGLSLGILHQCDGVVVMEGAHRDYLQARMPELRKVRLMSDFDPQPGPADVADPIGSTRSDYQECFDRLARGVDGMIRHIKMGMY